MPRVKSKALFRSFIFFGFLAAIAFIQWFWFANAWRWIGSVEHNSARYAFQALWVSALVVMLATFLEPFFGRLVPKGPFGTWLTGGARVWLVASVFAFLAYQSVELIGWISHAAAGTQRAAFDQGRRDAFRYIAYAAGSLPLLAATYGFAAGRLRYQVQRVEVPIQGLPKALDGLRIAQLSDIHIGEFMPQDEVRRAVDMTNDLRADLVAVTGDFVSNHNDPLQACISELGRLRAPLGVWGCNGNHEIYAGVEDAATELFQQHGMKLLRQESIQLDWKGAKLNLIGVDYQRDFMTRGPAGKCLQEVEHLVRHDMTNVLLSHNPNSFQRAADLGIELSLAGHTHGGQVQFEIVDHTISPARLITDFVAGLYRLPMTNGNSGRTAFLYVNRGLGTFGFPVRLGVPPEITLLTLRAA
jgi:predicted MPP superfamily phosphohydrolase